MLDLLRRGFLAAAVAIVVTLSVPATPASADGSGDEIVEQAKWTVEKFLADRDYR